MRDLAKVLSGTEKEFEVIWNFELPGPGKYELYIGDFENIQGPVLEVSAELLK